MNILLRLTTCLFALVLISGCEAEFSVGGSEEEQFDELIDGLVLDLVGPSTDSTPLDCPDLEGSTPGQYTCTSTVDGQDVTWAMTVTGLTSVSGGDSTAVSLVPDYGSPSADAERALLRSFRNDYDMVLTSMTCPPSNESAYNGMCKAVYEDMSFDVRFQQTGGGGFSYVPTGVGFRQNTEAAVARGLEQQSGLEATASCQTPAIWTITIGEEYTCNAQAVASNNKAVVRLVMTDMEGNFDWEVTSTSGGS